MSVHQEGAPLRFATFLAPNMLPVYRFLADRIADRLGRPVVLVAGTSFDQFEHGQADLGVICGLPYVWLVDAGAVDAAAIDSQVLAIELRDHPQLADRLRVVDTFGPSTIELVVAASRLPDQLKDEVRELLVELGDDPSARPALDHGFIQGFTAVDDSAYDDIRASLATIQAAGWTSLTQTAAGS